LLIGEINFEVGLLSSNLRRSDTNHGTIQCYFKRENTRFFFFFKDKTLIWVIIPFVFSAGTY